MQTRSRSAIVTRVGIAAALAVTVMLCATTPAAAQRSEPVTHHLISTTSDSLESQSHIATAFYGTGAGLLFVALGCGIGAAADSWGHFSLGGGRPADGTGSVLGEVALASVGAAVLLFAIAIGLEVDGGSHRDARTARSHLIRAAAGPGDIGLGVSLSF